jgi:putative resolvase
MEEKYPDYEIITDIGSGINFQRSGLIKLIDYSISGVLDTLVVAYKDRLCRIGYGLIEHLMLKYSNTNIIIELNNDETANEAMANDILQIITVYSAKINGMRSYKKDENSL